MTRVLLALALVALLAGCASTPPQQKYPRSGTSPRTRCMASPDESSLRPLFYLFCVESP